MATLVGDGALPAIHFGIRVSLKTNTEADQHFQVPQGIGKPDSVCTLSDESP